MGIVLYLLAVLIEIVSAIFRYLVGSWLGGPLLGYLLAGLPFAWSLLTLLGVPSDYLTSLEMGARRPSQRERDMVEPELTALYAQRDTIKKPHTWRVIDIPEMNAWVLGTTLYVSRELIRSPHLRAILAHELGHINALEARLMLALRRLAFPGGLIIVRLMTYGLTFIQPGSQEETTELPGGSLDAYNARLAAKPLQSTGCLHTILSWLLLGVVVFSGGFSLWFLSIPLMAYWRQREYEADRFAALLGEATGLAAALDYIRILDLPTPWLFVSRRAHPYSELRIDKLQTYATMQPEQIAKANAQAREDTILTAGSTLFFGVIGLLFFAICGLLPLIMLQPEGYEIGRTSVQATAQAGIDQQPMPSAQASAAQPTLQASKPAAQATPMINGSDPAPPGQDGQGRPVSYGFANLIDGDPATAWRTPGNSNVWLQFRYTEPVLVSSIALIPGYAKLDPSGANRFTENRRIIKARIIFANNQSIEATFRDAPEMQRVPLPQPIATTFVRIEVLETTESGGRDFTAVSELVIK